MAIQLGAWTAQQTGTGNMNIPILILRPSPLAVAACITYAAMYVMAPLPLPPATQSLPYSLNV